MESGTQPLDAILLRHALANHDLVAQSGEHLSHKVVQKARKGRMLTKHSQQKILRALNRAASAAYDLEELFNYRGR